jgi:hypothetical protein
MSFIETFIYIYIFKLYIKTNMLHCFSGLKLLPSSEQGGWHHFGCGCCRTVVGLLWDSCGILVGLLWDSCGSGAHTDFKYHLQLNKSSLVGQKNQSHIFY